MIKITVKEMKEWLNNFEDDQNVFIGSFNGLCGDTYKLDSIYIDVRKMESDMIDYRGKNGTMFVHEDFENNGWFYEREDALDYVNNIIKKRYDWIEKNKPDWNEEKIAREQKNLEELAKSKILKQYPVIYLYN